MQLEPRSPIPTRLRRALLAVTALNLAYFFVEFGVALRIDSVSLFADSVDFLEDACVDLLVLVALGWSARRRVRVGRLLAALLLAPAVATLWTAARAVVHAEPPDPVLLTWTGAGAFVVNLVCAVLLAAHREHPGSLVRAAFLSARNDVVANVAIVGAGLVTAWTRSRWPDLAVGLGIALLNADAAREVLRAAREEHDPMP